MKKVYIHHIEEVKKLKVKSHEQIIDALKEVMEKYLDNRWDDIVGFYSFHTMENNKPVYQKHYFENFKEIDNILPLGKDIICSFYNQEKMAMDKGVGFSIVCRGEYAQVGGCSFVNIEDAKVIAESIFSNLK